MADRRHPPGDLPPAVELRFGAGWRHLPGLNPVLAERQAVPDLVVDIVRAEDLVAFTLSGYDVELVTDGAPEIRPTGPNARLVIDFTFQHLGERAVYEIDIAGGEVPPPERNDFPGTDVPVKDTPPPIGTEKALTQPEDVLPAKTSRLVFAFPEGEAIPFTVTDVLDALGRLTLIVHPLATPKTTPKQLPGGPRFELPGGFEAALGRDGLIIRRAAAGDAPEGIGAYLRARRDLRRVRDILTRSAGIVVDADGELPVIGAGDVFLRPFPRRRLRPRPVLSRPPEPFETAIEAPFRLIVSPSDRGGWAHSHHPVRDPDAPHRVELWHSRLGIRGHGGVDEGGTGQRIIRAIWTRDREAMGDWAARRDADHFNIPFRMSLDPDDRHILVRQSAETWLDSKNRPIAPAPVDVTKLYLSSLGAWL
ncbi:MAG: hypothetical protein OEY62_07330, partial [Acidimicrobiia bacterium]|nr:hypothetical protein [Acidimicrobiia bacterium]